jgi:Zn-dependent peptidase ImmA (M78 family)
MSFRDQVRSNIVAENLANVIYNLSEQCLMAHTLRAAESHIRRETGNKSFSIILEIDDKITSRLQKKSHTTYAPQLNNACVVVAPHLDHDQKRVCIAHEVYHIIEHFKAEKTAPKDVEPVCDHFANALCLQHNAFYKDPEKIKKCQFGKLPINSM